MNQIYLIFQNNLDIVFFIYGLAFVTMGIAILIQPKKETEFKIGRIFWLLAAFGIIHGANEFMDMWVIIKGRNPLFDVVRWFTLIISYFFLFEFGRRLFRHSRETTPEWQRRITKPFVWWLMPFIVAFVLVAGFSSADFWKTGSTLARYLLCFPAGIVIGFGFFSEYKYEKETLKSLNVKRFFKGAGISFLIYGILSGVVVPEGDFFPANWINTDSFFKAVKIPVQVFRAGCAIVAAWAVSGILTIFNWEVNTKLKQAQEALKEQIRASETRYMEVVEGSSDIIHSLDPAGCFICTNKKGIELLGYSNEELLGKSLKETCTAETWTKIEDGLKRVASKGTLFLDNGEMIKKDGGNLDIELQLLAIHGGRGEFIGTRIIARDITDELRLEKELKRRVKELEEFYDIAVEREWKMMELKEEIEKLKEQIKKFRD